MRISDWSSDVCSSDLSERMRSDLAHVETLWAQALASIERPWRINGSTEARYRGNLNLLLPDIDAARLISDVRGVAFSAASACASGSGRPSHVLTALGLRSEEHTSELQSLMRISYAVFCLKKKIKKNIN